MNPLFILKSYMLPIAFSLMGSLYVHGMESISGEHHDNLKTKAVSMNHVITEPADAKVETGHDWKEEPLGLYINYGLSCMIPDSMKDKFLFQDGYEDLFHEFKPVDFDPAKLASLASRSGMKRLVFSAKHDDGFCMFNTATTSFNSCKAPLCRRDLVSEVAEACRKNKVDFGLFYSLNDYHYPQASGPASHGCNPVTPEHFRYIKTQITELLTSYTRINELWFDGGSLTFGQAQDLYFYIKKIQPECMIGGLGYDFCDYVILDSRTFPDLVPNGLWQFAEQSSPSSTNESIDAGLKRLTKVLCLGGSYISEIVLNHYGGMALADAQVAYALGDSAARMGLRETEGTDPSAQKLYKNIWLDRTNAQVIYGFSRIDDCLTSRTEMAYKWTLQDFGLHKVEFEFTAEQIGTFIILDIDGRNYEIELLPQDSRPVGAGVCFKNEHYAILPFRTNALPRDLPSYMREKKPYFLPLADGEGYSSILPPRTNVLYERSVYSDRDVDMPVEVISSDALELWLGEELLARRIHRNPGTAKETYLIPFVQGLNRIIVKTYTRVGGDVEISAGPVSDPSIYKMSFVIPDRIPGFRHVIRLSRKDPSTAFSDAHLQDISLRLL